MQPYKKLLEEIELLLKYVAQITKGTLQLRKYGGFSKIDWFLVYLTTYVKNICYAASNQPDSHTDRTWDSIKKRKSSKFQSCSNLHATKSKSAEFVTLRSVTN